MSALLIAMARYQANHAAWTAWLAGVPMSWLPDPVVSAYSPVYRGGGHALT